MDATQRQLYQSIIAYRYALAAKYRSAGDPASEARQLHIARTWQVTLAHDVGAPRQKSSARRPFNEQIQSTAA